MTNITVEDVIYTARTSKLEMTFVGSIGGLFLSGMIRLTLDPSLSFQLRVIGALVSMTMAYWIMNTLTRRLILTEDKIIRKNLLFADYEIDIKLLRSIGSLQYYTKVAGYQPIKILSIQGRLKNSKRIELNLKKLHLKNTLKLLRVLGTRLNPKFQFRFEDLEDLRKNQRRKVVEKYTCNSCSRKISLKGNVCPKCGAIAPICVICYVDPEPGDKISVLKCCGTFGHTNHLNTWFETNVKCPYCTEQNPGISKVKS